VHLGRKLGAKSRPENADNQIVIRGSGDLRLEACASLVEFLLPANRDQPDEACILTVQALDDALGSLPLMLDIGR
jgi:hypothetical protein